MLDHEIRGAGRSGQQKSILGEGRGRRAVGRSAISPKGSRGWMVRTGNEYKATR